MIPKPEEVLFESIVKYNPDFEEDGYTMDDFEEWKLENASESHAIKEAMKEYGRRLIDHVAEVAETRNIRSVTVVDKQSILKIKDELLTSWKKDTRKYLMPNMTVD